jgi:hypothetical protein
MDDPGTQTRRPHDVIHTPVERIDVCLSFVVRGVLLVGAVDGEEVTQLLYRPRDGVELELAAPVDREQAASDSRGQGTLGVAEVVVIVIPCGRLRERDTVARTDIDDRRVADRMNVDQASAGAKQLADLLQGMDPAPALHSTKRPRQDDDVEGRRRSFPSELLECNGSELDGVGGPLRDGPLRPRDRVREWIDRGDSSGPVEVSSRESPVAAPDLEDFLTGKVDEVEQGAGFVPLRIELYRHSPPSSTPMMVLTSAGVERDEAIATREDA